MAAEEKDKEKLTPGMVFPANKCGVGNVSKLWKGPTRKLGKYIIHGYPS